MVKLWPRVPANHLLLRQWCCAVPGGKDQAIVREVVHTAFALPRYGQPDLHTGKFSLAKWRSRILHLPTIRLL